MSTEFERAVNREIKKYGTRDLRSMEKTMVSDGRGELKGRLIRMADGRVGRVVKADEREIVIRPLAWYVRVGRWLVTKVRSTWARLRH